MKRTWLKRKTPLKGHVSLKRTPWKPNKHPSKMIIFDGIFSKFIRISYGGVSGIVVCMTCGKTIPWEEADCGHFQDRRHLATRYDERNVGPQCRDCNRYHAGRQEDFGRAIDAIHGEGTALLLERQAMLIVDDFPWDEKIAEYSEKLKRLVEWIDQNSVQNINYD